MQVMPGDEYYTYRLITLSHTPSGIYRLAQLFQTSAHRHWYGTILDYHGLEVDVHGGIVIMDSDVDPSSIPSEVNIIEIGPVLVLILVLPV